MEHREHCCCSSAKSAQKSCCHSSDKASGKSEKSCCGVEKKSGFLSDGKRLLISFAALLSGFCIYYFEWHFPFFPFSDPSWIAVLLCGTPIFKGAWKSLFYGRTITSALLISVAMFATISLQIILLFADGGAGHSHGSYIFAAGEIAFLMALGEMIEDRTVAKTRAGVEALVRLAPQTALKKIGGDFVEVEVSKIGVGDIVLVRPNDMISVDGIVVSGGGPVDQSSMTGESIPVEKSLGDGVFAGTWNKSGAMTIRVEREAKDSAIAKLIALVEEAEGKRAPIARAANKWASYIVPAAMLFSVLVFLYARFVLDASALSALVRGATVLVVFCPCAFALATPTAIAAGLGNAARRGILIKSGAALEEMSRVDTVVFDKTGTITKARLKVESMRGDGIEDAEFLRLIASAESHSEHPIAGAVLEYAKDRVVLEEPIATKSLSGVGVESVIGGMTILVSSYDSMKKRGADLDKGAEFAESRMALGETVICMAVDGKYAGALSLSDEIKDGAPEALQALKAGGYDTIILTGDNSAHASRVAQIVGVGKVFSSLMPQDKAEKIAELRRGGAKVCMLGDGVNDAPALANANVSVAMGALGSDLAVETADAAFLNDNIVLISGLLKFSKSVMRTIFANMGVSLFVSMCAIAASAYGLFGPVGGALIHNASSVLVVLNSARLIRGGSAFKG